MTKEIIRRTPNQVYDHWIAALRSGEFQQTKYTLRTDVRIDQQDGRESAFCCLGVACELAERDGGAKWNGRSFMKTFGSMPTTMRTFIGLNMKHHGRLVKMNDIEKKTFAEIADYIENTIKPAGLELLAAKKKLATA